MAGSYNEIIIQVLNVVLKAGNHYHIIMEVL